MKTLDSCIVCNSKDFTDFISCKDHTVSKNSFTIQKCSSCGFLFTNPRPEDDQLGKYYKSEEYVSHSDTKKGLINTLYHWVRNYTLLKKYQLVLQVSGIKKGSVLDYGCGTGAFLDTFKKGGWDVDGFEPDADARKVCQDKFGFLPFSKVEELEASGKAYDVITLWHVIEHIPDLDNWFARIAKLLKPGGSLIIACPNASSFDANHYQEFWAAYDLPRHLWHFTPETIGKLFLSKGYKQSAIRPMVFDSFYVSLLSEKYKESALGLINAFLIGLWSNIKANKTGTRFSSQIYCFKRQ